MANQAEFPVRTLCRVLDVSASGYYAWCERKPSTRRLENVVLSERIRIAHVESDGTYGRPRIAAELREQGAPASEKRIGKLMREMGIHGISRRRGFVVTTRRKAGQERAPDLVDRRFTAPGPNRLWVADMTYVPSWAGFIYLAVVVDAWSRRVVGWSIGEHMRAELVLSALNMAISTRRPEQVIHHSDHGSQYASVAFGKRCREMGVRLSMGSVGDAYDNAMAESFFATLETELLDRRSFKTKTEARLAVFTWIEGWYNPRRRHSSLGQISPARFEERNATPKEKPLLPDIGLPTAPLAASLRGAGGGAVDNPVMQYDLHI